MQFKSKKNSDLILEIELSSAVAYLPTVIRKRQKDVETFNLIDVKYHRQVVDGNTLFTVESATTHADLPKGGHSQVQTVKASAVDLNPTVSPERFVIKPWPSEQVIDFDSQKVTRASNPMAPMPKTAEFPFRDFVMAGVANDPSDLKIASLVESHPTTVAEEGTDSRHLPKDSDPGRNGADIQERAVIRREHFDQLFFGGAITLGLACVGAAAFYCMRWMRS